MMRNALIVSALWIVCLSCVGLRQNGADAASIFESAKVATNDVKDALGNLCITSDGCAKEFFNLRNYCCTAQCCNYFQYIFQDSGTAWDNFVYTCKNPRAINIIILVLLILVLCSVISVIMSIIGYFVCGCSRICCCCGQRKYSMVNH